VNAGERLPQPALCPDDLYKLWLKCWDSKVEKRPSFKELTAKLLKLKKKDTGNPHERDVGVVVKGKVKAVLRPIAGF